MTKLEQTTTIRELTDSELDGISGGEGGFGGFVRTVYATVMNAANQAIVDWNCVVTPKVAQCE